MKKKKQSITLGIILLILALGIGYAYLNTTLNITGTTDVDSNTWDVYWDNVQVTTGSVTAEEPEIDMSGTIISFSVHLEQPGDFYEFTVDAKNDGSIDAMIETVTKTINNNTTVPTYLDYEVTYSDGVEILENQLLEANTTETYKVRITYRDDIDPDDLPNSAQSLNLVFGVEYIQGDIDGFKVRTTIYDVSDTIFTLDSNVPAGVTTYDNYQDAVTAFGHPFFLKHTVVNNIITESYVGFVLNDTVYYLRGGVDESSLTTKPIYEANKAVLLSAFGSENCTEGYHYYYCYDSASGVRADANPVSVHAYNDRVCQIYDTFYSNCDFSG